MFGWSSGDGGVTIYGEEHICALTEYGEEHIYALSIYGEEHIYALGELMLKYPLELLQRYQAGLIATQRCWKIYDLVAT
jgi:hypothetical protein